MDALGDEGGGRRSRRRFLREAGLAPWAAGLGGSLALPAWAYGQDKDSGPVDCGPPPRAKPQERNAPSISPM